MQITILNNKIKDSILENKLYKFNLPKLFTEKTELNKNWVGCYRLGERGLEVRIVEGSYFLYYWRDGIQGFPPEKLYPKSENTFFVKSMDIEYVFKNNQILAIHGKMAQCVYECQQRIFEKINKAVEATPDGASLL